MVAPSRADAAARWWAAPFDAASCASMCDKYTALVELAKCEPRPSREALRRVARRWPAALREAELVAPTRIEARRAQSAARLESPPVERAALREAGWAALPLWADLHARLGELAKLRRASRGARVDHAGALAHLDAPARAHWLDAETLGLGLAAGAPLRVRHAYLSVAWRSGLSMAELGAQLFERSGRWDASPEDPAWSRVGALR